MRCRRAWHGWRLVLALMLGGTGVSVDAAAVRDVRLDQGRMVIRFDAPVTDAASLVAAGARQILVQVRGATPDRAGDDELLDDPVARVTQSRRDGGTRFALDLTGPTVVGDAGFQDGGRTLVLQLRPVSRAAFAAAGEAGWSTYLPLRLSGGSRYRVTRLVPPRVKAGPLPRVTGEPGKPLVVIDPGHGGIDPGAINPVTGLREKDVTLKIARAIREQLAASGRVRVALTREDDRFLVLRERFGIARRLHADLFLSIHCDSTGSEDATGASAYTLSEVASDKEAARLAARENKADVIGGVDLGGAGADVQSILIDLTQRETMNASAGFARLLGREARPLIPVKAQFHRMASLMVLKAPDLPSVLFETGYISNPADAAFLDSADGRERVAESVEHAVEAHFARRMAAR